LVTAPWAIRGSFSRTLVVLLCSDLAIWAGFYMLMPFLPARMTALGHSGTVVGVVLAIRLLCQQGTMPISGALADRWGYRRALLSGLALRACGFTLMAVATSVPMLAMTAILSGIGGSLIGGAFKASYTAAPGGADLAVRFLWLAMADRLGQAIGPLLGTAASTFALQAYLAVTLFVAVAIAIRLWLPEDEPATAPPIWHSIVVQLRNRRLVGLVAVFCGYWAIQQQLSVLIPLAAARLGAPQTVGTLVSLSAVAGLMLILCMPRLRMERLWHQLLLAQGVTAGSMALPLWVPGYPGIAFTTVGLAIAAVLAQPALDALVGALSSPETRASAYGFSALSFGIGGAIGQVLGGWSWSMWAVSAPWLPWSLFTGLGILTLAGLHLLKNGVKT
jgi:DHA1 family multidrug resistance protein-like MFS transporter